MPFGSILCHVDLYRRNSLTIRMASQEKVHKIDEDRLSMISRMSLAVANVPKSDITELKSFNAPPQLVKEVLSASLNLLEERKETPWQDVKKALGSPGFQKRIQDLDPESVPADRRRKARQMLGDASKEKVAKISAAMVTIFEWCEAVAED